MGRLQRCVFRVSRNLYNRRLSANQGKGDPNKNTFTKDGAVKWIQSSLIPVALNLVKTTRHHVERIKRDTEKLDIDFKTVRTNLLEATRKLDNTKENLQELYLRREFEYRKGKSDVQIIREINEKENILKEREEREQNLVDKHTQNEQELFEKTRLSHQLLYETTRTYAHRYIVLGLTLGTTWSIWKAYQFIINTKPYDEPISTSTTSADIIIEQIKAHNEMLSTEVINEIKSTNIELKNHVVSSNDSKGSTVEDLKKESSSTVPNTKGSTVEDLERESSSSLLTVSVVSGMAGSIFLLLLYKLFFG